MLGTRQLAYGDDVRGEPETQVAYRALGRKLCLDGLSYGSSYAVTLKSGLPGEIGALEKDAVIDIAIGDRPRRQRRQQRRVDQVAAIPSSP